MEVTVKDNTPEIKVGDLVRTVATGEYHDLPAGEVGFVQKIFKSGEYPIRVRGTVSNDYDYFSAEDLQRLGSVEDALAAMPESKPEKKVILEVTKAEFGFLSRAADAYTLSHPITRQLDGVWREEL